jgi:hypothetical protein
VRRWLGVGGWEDQVVEDVHTRARIVVTALYQSLLKREPDLEGLDVHANALAADFSSARLSALIASFAQSPEILARGLDRNLEEPSQHDAAVPISLGEHCYTSTVLKALRLKQSSFPFDWLFSNQPLVMHCLADDFRDFLDRRFYQPIPLDQRSHPHVNLCAHTLFRDRYGVKAVFNHRDPSLEEDYAYLSRCVDRFRAALRADRPPTFFITFRLSGNATENFFRLKHAVQSIRADARLIGFAIDQPGHDAATEELAYSEEGTYLGIIHPMSEWLDVRFSNAFDDLFLIGRLSVAMEEVQRSS